MNKKHELSSTLSKLFAYNIYIITVGIFFFLIYSIIIFEVSAIIFCLILELLVYIKFLRLLFKAKNIFFDSENIYFDNETIPLKDILEIKNGKITYVKNEILNYVYYNYCYAKNNSLLNNFYISTKKISL